MREIEAAAGIAFTAIVHNSNLGNDTTVEAITTAAKNVKELSALSGLPVLFTAAKKELCPALSGELLPLTLQAKYYE